MGPQIKIASLVLGLILLLGGMLLYYRNRNKRKLWPDLLGIQGCAFGLSLIIISHGPVLLSIGLFLLLEAMISLTSAHILRYSKFSKKDILIAASYIVSVLCAAVFYTIIFTLDTSLEWVSQLLLFSAGIASLGAVGMVSENLAKKRGFIKTLIISLVAFIGFASFMSAVAKTPLRTFVSWTLLLESIFLFAYVIRKACIKSRKQAFVGLIALIACLGLLTALIVKSPHDPLFNFLPARKGMSTSIHPGI